MFRAYSFQGRSCTVLVLRHRSRRPTHDLQSNNSVTFKNFWVALVQRHAYLRGLDAQMTRGGPSMGTPLGWSRTRSLRNSTGVEHGWSGTINYQPNEFGDHTLTTTLSSRRARPRRCSSRSARNTRTRTAPRHLQRADQPPVPDDAQRRPRRDLRQALHLRPRRSHDAVGAVPRQLHVQAGRDARRLRGTVRGERPVPRVRRARRLAQPQPPRSTAPTALRSRAWPTAAIASPTARRRSSLANRDFNVRSFRSNVVLRWEWRPGSTLVWVWQQNRASTVAEGQHVGVNDLFGSLSAPGDNIFALKTTIWIAR